MLVILSQLKMLMSKKSVKINMKCSLILLQGNSLSQQINPNAKHVNESSKIVNDQV